MLFPIFAWISFRLLLRFQMRRRRSETTPTLEYPIRNILFEWNQRSTIPETEPASSTIFVYATSLLAYIDLHTCFKIKHSINDQTDAILERYHERDEPFNVYLPITSDDYPPGYEPVPGIRHAERRYHSIGSDILNTDDKQTTFMNDPHFIETPDARSAFTNMPSLDLTGSPPIPEIVTIINEWFPEYIHFLSEYCRPPSYGPQAIADFLRATPLADPPTPERHEAIMHIIRHKFNIRPYRPLHFADALAANTPLGTSASYYSKFSSESRILARYSAPSLYQDKPTSKGHFINVMLNQYRLEYHFVKYEGAPFPTDSLDPEAIEAQLDHWFALHPTQLFIRTQISKRDPTLPKKIRPVYSVDDRFLHLEKTLFTPALAQLRNPECCVAHGLETFRGSMTLLDRISLFFKSFISLDWSQFDQRLPLYVIKAFFLDYLPSLLIVSAGYMPTRNYPDSSQPTPDFAWKIFRLVRFLYLWYRRMTFLSFDGFSFIRDHGGVPSGLLNTQFLDSFGNMYIILDCLLEFGFSNEETLQMLFCVLGDDNLIFLDHNLERVTEFMNFLSRYCEPRTGMVISILKSVYSNLRTKISFLSYTNNFGQPTREIGKLVAQLAMPERPVNPDRQWIHAARALGLAYASCGQDYSFHLLCFMVYQKFKPDNPVSGHQIRKVFRKWIHEIPELDVTEEFYSFGDFPSLMYIRQRLSAYHGPFSDTDKWNFRVFTVPPTDNLDEYTTLKDYIPTDPQMYALLRDLTDK
nr:RNA-dependent RNA polymerase [Sarcosphaera coronaria partitivirus]